MIWEANQMTTSSQWREPLLGETQPTFPARVLGSYSGVKQVPWLGKLLRVSTTGNMHTVLVPLLLL